MTWCISYQHQQLNGGYVIHNQPSIVCVRVRLCLILSLMWEEAVLRDYLLVMMLLSSILSHISRKGWCHSLT